MNEDNPFANLPPEGEAPRKRKKKPVNPPQAPPPEVPTSGPEPGWFSPAEAGWFALIGGLLAAMGLFLAALGYGNSLVGVIVIGGAVATWWPMRQRLAEALLDIGQHGTFPAIMLVGVVLFARFLYFNAAYLWSLGVLGLFWMGVALGVGFAFLLYLAFFEQIVQRMAIRMLVKQWGWARGLVPAGEIREEMGHYRRVARVSLLVVKAIALVVGWMGYNFVTDIQTNGWEQAFAAHFGDVFVFIMFLCGILYVWTVFAEALAELALDPETATQEEVEKTGRTISCLMVLLLVAAALAPFFAPLPGK